MDRPCRAAFDLSSDGSVVVGEMWTNLGHVPFIWDQANGMRNLQEMLSTDYGLDLTGWRLGGASGISADGKTIIGNGINPDGNSEAWVARIPEPTTFFLLALGGLVFWRRMARQLIR